MKTYEQFLEDLARSESSGSYQSVNKETGYLGKYQMGKLALIDSGYYREDGSSNNSFLDKYWTGKDGVKSKHEFLNTHQAQENAIRAYMRVQWQYLLNAGVDRYIGETRFGLMITVSGALAGAHLVGWTKVGPFVKRGAIAYDGSKPPVPITKYIQKFSGYETPFSSRKKLTGIKKDKKGKTTHYEVDRASWISKSEAIQMVRDWILDAVIVTNHRGTVFLKTSPDKSKGNNLRK